MFTKIGSFAVKFRFWIILAWVVLAVLLFFLAPALSQVSSMKEASFLPSDSQSLRARELISRYFPDAQAASTVTLVFYDAETISETDRAYINQVSEWLNSGSPPFGVKYVTSVFTNPELETRLVSPDGTTMLLNAGLDQVAFEADSSTTTEAIRDYVKSAPSGLEVYVSGQVGIYSDVYAYLSKSIDLTTLITAILVIVLLVIIYRSPIAALVPLVTIGLAFIVARGITAFIGQAGISIWSQIEIFFIVMIFGIGTDYCLFLISRFREELATNGSRHIAMQKAVGKVGVVIAASALAVIVGMAGLVAADYQMIKTMGPLLGIAILITLLAALTLAPALAAVFGRKLFWPLSPDRKTVQKSGRQGFWDKVAGLTVRRPLWVAIAAAVIMLLPYLALPRLNSSFDQMAEIPASSESISGYTVLKQHYDIGEMDPLTALVVVPQGETITSPQSLAALQNIETDLRRVEGVVKVQYLLDPQGNGTPLTELTASGQLAVIQQSLADSLGQASVNPALFLNDEITSGFSQLGDYLTEMAAAFTWVINDPAYQAVLSSLTNLPPILDQVRSAALVENQLETIRSEIGQMGQALNDPAQLLQPQTTQTLSLLQAYLNELATAYPEVSVSRDYQTLQTLVQQFQLTLSNAASLSQTELNTLLSSLPSSLQLMDSSLSGLAGDFRGRDAVLLSAALSQAAGAESPAALLTLQLENLKAGLAALIQSFQAQGDPAFLSVSLLGNNAEATGLMETFVDESQRAAKLYIVLDAYPQSDAALKTVRSAREALETSLQTTSLAGAEAVIGGTSAELADVQTVLDADFSRIMVVVLIAIFIVLALLLRSLIAPVYLLVTVMLSYGTTLGLVSWIFQGLLGQDGISFLIPIIVLVLLVALGSDYNIFLMSRVKEETQKHGTREGVRLAVIATGGVITACGIILAGTFGALVVTPIRTLMQVGASVAIGVLIDTFVVRALLVPSLARLLGRWNWWPSRK